MYIIQNIYLEIHFPQLPVHQDLGLEHNRARFVSLSTKITPSVTLWAFLHGKAHVKLYCRVLQLVHCPVRHLFLVKNSCKFPTDWTWCTECELAPSTQAHLCLFPRSEHTTLGGPAYNQQRFPFRQYAWLLKGNFTVPSLHFETDFAHAHTSLGSSKSSDESLSHSQWNVDFLRTKCLSKQQQLSCSLPSLAQLRHRRQ